MFLILLNCIYNIRHITLFFKIQNGLKSMLKAQFLALKFNVVFLKNNFTLIKYLNKIVKYKKLFL